MSPLRDTFLIFTSLFYPKFKLELLKNVLFGDDYLMNRSLSRRSRKTSGGRFDGSQARSTAGIFRAATSDGTNTLLMQ